MINKLLLILILFPLISWGQVSLGKTNTVSGVVLDGTEPLPGVNINIKGTTVGVSTDFNGSFQISANSDAVLVFSFLGFKNQEVKITNFKVLKVVLEKDEQLLNGIEVQGFAGVVGKARKRTESIQSIPETITAFNADDIEKIGINNITNFANYVPNLKLSQSQAVGVNSLVIRGIPQIRNTDAPVAFVIDGVTISDPSLLNQELFDLALIEVVKGPQGAVYGKNAIGGAINIYSKEPTNYMDNKITVGYGNGNALTTRLISSGAIKKDKVFYRFSTQYKNFDGLLTNEFLNKKVDFRKDFTTRGQLTFKLSSKFKINTTAQYIDSKGGAAYYSISPDAVNNDGYLTTLNPNPAKGNNVISQDTFGNSSMKNFFTNINMEYLFDNLKLQSITSYSNVKRKMTGDLDFTEVFVLDQGETNNTKSINQEIRLSNKKQNTKLDWSLGGFYQHIDRPFVQTDALFNPEYKVTDYIVTFKTLAAFGFLDYKFTDKFSVSAGLRFDNDRFSLNDFLNAETNSKKANVLQPKLSFSYKLTKDVMTYANYGRGYRAGGYNPKVTPLFNRDFKGELSDNYEIGFKTSSWNNRFIFNGAVFYSDFTNRQQFAITGDDFTPGNFNYNKSNIAGFELDTKLRATKYLDFLFNYGFVKSTIKEGGTTGGADGKARDLNQFNGKNTSLVPQNNFNVGVQSHIPISDNKTLDITADYSGTGKIYWEDSNSPEFTSKAYQLLSATVGLTVNKLKFTVWGRNILNKQYYLEYTDYGIGWRGTPATAGATVTVNF